MLFEDFDSTLRIAGRDFFTNRIPEYILRNLNPAFALREYQKEAIGRLVYYWDGFPESTRPTHLLFHMATGSGKTLIMAAAILHLYERGYRIFVFCVNSTNIIEKTRANFLQQLSAKYLFGPELVFGDKRVRLREVENFEATNPEDISIVFSTVQGLHSRLNTPREGSITYEDFPDKQVVLISDEAHHINTLTKSLQKKTLNKEEAADINSWEGTVDRIFRASRENVMLEFTATAGLDDPAIRQKYDDKVIFEYSLKQFRQDGFSKDVEVLQADLEPLDRALQAVVLSQYRRKVAAKNAIQLKPVLLMKSHTIAESQAAETDFLARIRTLRVADLRQIQVRSGNGILKKAFDYFRSEGVTLDNLVREIRQDFSETKCLSINSKDDSEQKQLIVNSLEDTDNEYRVIFAVDKLNEGWDVLNLFDIVRLYETRDSKSGTPGKTTISEAQLIGRGARYYPFAVDPEQDPYTRKFDEDINSPLRVLEQLHYHSSHNPRYISELKRALVETGIVAQEEKTLDLIVKDSFKRSELWEVGKIYLNDRKAFDRSTLFGLADIGVERQLYKVHCPTGQLQEVAIFEEAAERPRAVTTSATRYRLTDFGKYILRKALQREGFYRFSNLKRFFPTLKSVSEFIEGERNLASVELEVYASQNARSLNAEERLAIAGKVLDAIRKQVIEATTDYVGTQMFNPHAIKLVVKDKALKMMLDPGGDQERGRPMSDPQNRQLFLDLKQKEWYVYEENFGTSEEKFFVKFIDSICDKLRRVYADVYLLRNASLFQIYRFSDGKAFEPDFVLFLRKKRAKTTIVYQLFIEPKGQHLLAAEQEKWKEDFLLEIKAEHRLSSLFENEQFELLGMPFYNETATKRRFNDDLEEALGLRT